MPGLKTLYKRIANGVPDLRILNRERTPGNGAEYFRWHAQLSTPTGESYVRLTNIAMAENANANGVEFHF